MKKPERRTITDETSYNERNVVEGFNECWEKREEWLEEFLPSVEEIETILILTGYGSSVIEKAIAIANRLEIKK